MGVRRRAREIGLQVLYSLDVQPDLGVEAAIAAFFRDFDEEASFGSAAANEGRGGEGRDFVERLVRGVVEHQPEIDAQIAAASRNWRLERMARVDRNLLRLAVFEMTYSDEVPAKAAINEAIEIAKRFGAQESPSFVNGILDRVLAARR